MPLILPFHPETASATITIDGVTYRVPIVDSDGHLQVDVLSNPLATDAATATDQATMITALQLIDDLRAALDAVRTDRLNVNVYRDGASEVKATRLASVSDTSVRATVLTPTSGKKVRVISCSLMNTGATKTRLEVYFSTGATIVTDVTKAIMDVRLVTAETENYAIVWSDGGGPVGAVNEVVSFRTGADIGASGVVLLHYREE